MKRILIIVAVIAAVVAGAFGYFALRGPSVESTMKEMQANYKAAMSSTTMAEFAPIAAKLQTAAAAASKQPYDGSQPNQVVYGAGMMELNQEMAELNQAIMANDLEKAKQVLAKIIESKKKYHKTLGV